MSLQHELENVFADGYRAEYNKVHDFYSLYVLMDKATVDMIVAYLLIELEGRNRPSYISRLYGRYRKMLPKRDQETLQNWKS